jgi:hypothetical protein
MEEMPKISSRPPAFLEFFIELRGDLFSPRARDSRPLEFDDEAFSADLFEPREKFIE